MNTATFTGATVMLRLPSLAQMVLGLWKSFLAIALFCLISAFINLAGCVSRAPVASAAEAAYLGQQLECVDKAETRSEADVCRSSVKAKWVKK